MALAPVILAELGVAVATKVLLEILVVKQLEGYAGALFGAFVSYCHMAD